MRTVDWTIISIGAIAFGHNAIALVRGKQLICERVNDYRTVNKWVTDGVIIVLALHMLRRLPYDPLSKLAGLVSARLAKAAGV